MYVKTAVEHFGNKTKIAQALGISPKSGAVTQWGEIVPEKQALRLEKLTGGELCCISELYQKGRS